MGKVKKLGPMSYREYAKHRGVSPEAVSKAVKTGRISASSKGKIDPAIADQEWEANTDPSRNPSRAAKATDGEAEAASVSGGLPPYAQSRAIREAYEARLSKLEYEVKTGKLINADEVRVVVFNVGRITRDKLMGLPDRVSSILSGLRDSHEIHKLLSAEIRLICEELSNDATKSSRSNIS